jgi:YegS/Rv2252/BmrU family lipid kinase
MKEGRRLYHMIVNPVAGNGRSLKACVLAENELKRRGLPYRIVRTEQPGHATAIAREIAAGEDGARLVLLGGDGTLNEAANGVAGTNAILYFVSCGTGNDFVKTLGLPKDPAKALALQLDASPRAIDAGLINDRLFLNVSGTGFDIEVLRQTQRFRARFKGLAAYLMGLLAALGRFTPVEATVTAGGRTFKARLTIIEVANGRYYGGGMLVAPDANPSDGLFDLVYVDAVDRRRILKLLPLFVNGRFIRLPITHMLRAEEVVIESPGMTVNLDGELLKTDRAHYRVLPGGLRISCP